MGIFTREKDPSGNPEGTGPSESALDPALAAAAAAEGGGRKRRSDAGRPRRVSRHREETPEVTQEEIDALFQKENWEALTSLYFDTRFVMTKFEPFRLSEKENARLAQTMATTMKVLLKIDPAYIAVVVFTVNFGGTIAAKEALWSQEKSKRAAATPRRPVAVETTRVPT